MAMLKVYTKDQCPGCLQVKRMLTYLQVPYQERRVDVDVADRNWVVERGFRSLPVLELEGFEPVSGTDPAVVERLLVQARLL